MNKGLMAGFSFDIHKSGMGYFKGRVVHRFEILKRFSASR
jgi:hypothetical protein